MGGYVLFHVKHLGHDSADAMAASLRQGGRGATGPAGEAQEVIRRTRARNTIIAGIGAPWDTSPCRLRRSNVTEAPCRRSKTFGLLAEDRLAP